MFSEQLRESEINRHIEKGLGNTAQIELPRVSKSVKPTSYEQQFIKSIYFIQQKNKSFLLIHCLQHKQLDRYIMQPVKYNSMLASQRSTCCKFSPSGLCNIVTRKTQTVKSYSKTLISVSSYNQQGSEIK